MKAVKSFTDMPLSQRRAYLKAAQAFYKPRLLADKSKQGKVKPVNLTKQ